MANLFSRLRSGERMLSSQTFNIGMDDLASYFQYGSQQYPLGLNQTLVSGSAKEIPASFTGFLELAYKRNPVIYACMEARRSLFSQARFKFQRVSAGKEGDLFGTNDLAILEAPWPNGMTSDLLSRAIQDADLAGNAYFYRDGNQLRRLRPDWVSILLGSQVDSDEPQYAWDAEVIGYVYHPPMGESIRTFLPEEVCHFAPIPDPAAKYRGMSWLEPVIREITADNAMTTHQIKYFENGATPNLVVSLDSTMNQSAFERWISAFRNNNEGVANAYKTMYLAGGANATVVGSKLEDFKTVKGHGETRIAAAARVPAVIAGISEGLQGSSLNAGNFSAARRLFADGTMRELWATMADAMAPLVNVPGGAKLWYDASGIPFLAEDQADAAQVLQQNAATMHTLIAAGYKPDSVNAFMASGGDYSLLDHTDLYSVQLQPAGTLTEGKGAVVQGVPTPNGTAPAKPPSASPAKSGANGGRQDEITDLLLRASGRDGIEPPKSAKAGKAYVEVGYDRDAISKERLHTLEIVKELVAARGDVHVDVQPATAPDVRVDVAPAEVRVDPTEVTVNLPEQAPADVNVTVEPAEVNVRVEPTDLTVNVPEQPAPSVTVEPTEVTVNVPEQRAPDVNVTVDAPQVDVHVPEQASPNVYVDGPEINVPEQRAPDVTINVDVPEQAAPHVDVHVPKQDPRGFKIRRDPETGRPTGIDGPESFDIKRDEHGRIEGVE